MEIKERVLAFAKTSYAKYGFKKEELGQLASILAENLNNDSTDDDIKNTITTNEGFARMMQSVYNRGISETTEKYKNYVPKTEPAKVEPEPQPSPVVAPLTIESVQELIKKANATKQKEIDEAVQKAVAPLIERENKARLKSLLNGHEKLKAIPEVFRNNYSLDKEENLDAVATQIESDWATTMQQLVASGKYVEAPKQSDPQSETDDFVKQMQGFAERNKPKEN